MIGTYWNTDPLNDSHQEVTIELPDGDMTLVLGSPNSFQPGSGLDTGINMKHPDGSLTPVIITTPEDTTSYGAFVPTDRFFGEPRIV